MRIPSLLLLREKGFSLQASTKTREGCQHADWDALFRYLNELARDHRDAGPALPLARHAFQGDWNYVLRPQWVPAVWSGRPAAPQWDPALLSDPALPGLAPHQQQLIQALASEGDTRRGCLPRLAFDDQVLATVLHLRVNLAAEPLAVLFAR